MTRLRGHRLFKSAFALPAALTLVFGVLLSTPPAWAGTGPHLAWSPVTVASTPAYYYGAVPSGTTVPITFTLTNSGGQSSAALTITLSNPTGEPAFAVTADGCTGLALGSGRSCQVSVYFTQPTDGTLSTATLEASSPKPATALATIQLVGAPAASISVSPSSWNLGTVPAGTAVAETFTVTNTGFVDFLPDINSGSNNGDEISYWPAGAIPCDWLETLPAGTSCTFSLAIYFLNPGTINDWVQVSGLDTAGEILASTTFNVTGTAS